MITRSCHQGGTTRQKPSSDWFSLWSSQSPRCRNVLSDMPASSTSLITCFALRLPQNAQSSIFDNITAFDSDFTTFIPQASFQSALTLRVESHHPSPPQAIWRPIFHSMPHVLASTSAHTYFSRACPCTLPHWTISAQRWFHIPS